MSVGRTDCLALQVARRQCISASLQCIAANGLTFEKLWVYGWTKGHIRTKDG
jgi:hypothetical protein